jgi:thiamine-monophosphate kinase
VAESDGKPSHSKGASRYNVVMEREFIDWLRDQIPPHPLLLLEPGDDAAVLNMRGVDECVVTVDLLTDQVDFILSEVDPRRVGRKALAVNLSDLAAMAAEPLAAVIAVALPRKGARELAMQLYEGILPLAEKYKVAIAGGDTNTWDGPLVITATLLGRVTAREPLRRNLALPGDRIVVTGAFGGSILGRQFDFEPRIHEALALNERFKLHAGMDVSDGLALDLSRLAESSGVGAIVDIDRIPIHKDARRISERDGRSPLEHALADGEDFELLLAVGPKDAKQLPPAIEYTDVKLTDIGEFTAKQGLWQRDAEGVVRPLTPTGWEH